MDNKTIFSHVDHTLLAPTATWSQIQTLCDEAITYGVASVCIPPSYVNRTANQHGDNLTVCTVVGFPLGYAKTEAKVRETELAIHEGAKEIDMVVNQGDVKNGDFSLVTAEITALKQACGDNILKVIIETCNLTDDEKIKLCHCITEGGADYIKTSTGFGSAGATPEDIALFKAHIGPKVKIKAAGGIRTREDMVRYIEQGCDRLGTSSAVKILSGVTGTGY
ncbi:MAG: deoxyribose-phosphate aldolase [Oscillospiraceae bacterium]|nr:deoxyribose-phosphate aldolase [Oscillospiraceae bacterium]